MLKTSSKQARANVRAYIVNHFNPDSYDFRGDSSDWETVSRYIMERFEREKRGERGTRAELFADWCAGLPSVLDTCYYYNRSAVVIWEQSWRRRTPKNRATQSNKPKKCLRALFMRNSARLATIDGRI